MSTQKEYEGHVIKIDDHYTNMRFEVSGPLFNGDYGSTRSFDSYAQAVEEIDKRLKLSRQEAVTHLSLEVLKHDASGVTKIKGLHARHGNLLFTDGPYSKQAAESYTKIDYVYPNVQWIADLIRERAALYKRRDEIDKTLSKYKIKVAYCYGSRISYKDTYAEQIDLLKKEHADKVQWAHSANDQGQAA